MACDAAVIGHAKVFPGQLRAWPLDVLKPIQLLYFVISVPNDDDWSYCLLSPTKPNGDDSSLIYENVLDRIRTSSLCDHTRVIHEP